MNATILDTITAAFVGALQTGQGALAQYSLPLLAVFAVIALYLNMGHLVISGGAGVGDALGATLLSVLKIGTLYWLLVNLTTGGGDPTFYSAVVCGLTSVIFAILSWVIPGRASAIAGRGVSLALHAATPVAGAASGARVVVLASGAIRGISSLIRRR